MTRQEARYDWKCARCGLGPVPHSTADSTCVWEPIPVEEARDDALEMLIEEARRWPNPDGVKMAAPPIDLIRRLADALESKHPEPEVTDDEVFDAYRTFRDNGSGPIGMRAALEATLRAPVGEGERATAAPVVGERIPGDELRVDSPSYSVRRLLSALDGIATSDEEFSTAAEYVDAGGTITIRDSQGFPLYELRIQGNPTSEEEMPDA